MNQLVQGEPARSGTAAVHYSVVIPVFNSEAIVASTIARTVSFFEQFDPSFEIILVDDGSSDDSWKVIAGAAAADARVSAIRLLGNSGQHAANLCGFRRATGDWVVTMDDDLQNPPEEIRKLALKAHEGYDLVLGRFQQKQHATHRRLGSRLVRLLNRRIFRQEPDLVLSNFRLIRRDVVDRVCAYRGPYPYIPGLCLMFSAQRANALVEHHPRAQGASNYNFRRILRLVAAILFNYSSFPLRLVAGVGTVIAVCAFLLGLYFLVAGLLSGTRVEGWTSLIVLLSLFNGVIMIMLGMLGEYVVRIINQVSNPEPYLVRELVDRDA